jgi:hypothetical protein
MPAVLELRGTADINSLENFAGDTGINNISCPSTLTFIILAL